MTKIDKFVNIIVRYLGNHLANLFAGAFDERDVSPLEVQIPMPTDAQGMQPRFIIGFQNSQSLGDGKLSTINSANGVISKSNYGFMFILQIEKVYYSKRS